MPKRIILVRHGESEGNLDGTAYTITPDNKIPLTQLGIQQSKIAGQQIRRVISDDDTRFNWKVYFYVSPYERTRATLREIGRSFCRESVIGAREEVRVREQDFGNFQESERMKTIKETRERYGRFFYRFPEGESAADVFDRVSSKIISSNFFSAQLCTYVFVCLMHILFAFSSFCCGIYDFVCLFVYPSFLL